jgi:hypothetical protein
MDNYDPGSKICPLIRANPWYIILLLSNSILEKNSLWNFPRKQSDALWQGHGMISGDFLFSEPDYYRTREKWPDAINQRLNSYWPCSWVREAIQILKIDPNCCFVWKSGKFWNLLDNFLLSKSYSRRFLDPRTVENLTPNIDRCKWPRAQR